MVAVGKRGAVRQHMRRAVDELVGRFLVAERRQRHAVGDRAEGEDGLQPSQ